MPVTNIPKYPVVDPNPEIGKTLMNFNFNDYTRMGAMTYGSYLLGWFGCKLSQIKWKNTQYFVKFQLYIVSLITSSPHKPYHANNLTASKLLRRPNSKFCATIGFLAGLTAGHMCSTQRFMGIMKNDSEVASFGIMDAELVAEYHKRSYSPNIDLINSGRNDNKK